MTGHISLGGGLPLAQRGHLFLPGLGASPCPLPSQQTEQTLVLALSEQTRVLALSEQTRVLVLSE